MPPKKEAGRDNLVPLTIRIDKQLHKQLGHKAIDDETTIQAIVTAAIEKALGVARQK